MSKYTTEVRFICETECGLVESKGYKETKSIITKAAPKVFDFDYPIFDEKYRIPLEVKILRHYYTREICEETVGLWKLRLEDKMNLIMPYYNKLYETELLKFNPLYDVDLHTSHDTKHDGSEIKNTESHEDVKQNTTKDVTEVGNTKGTTVSDETSNKSIGTDASKKINTDTLNTVDSDANKTSETDGTKVVDSSTSNASDSNKTQTIKNDRSSTASETGNNTSENNTERETNATASKTVDTDTTSDNTNTGDSTGTTNTDQHADSHESSTRWDLYSDTPQGGINGIIGDGDSVANNTYLTNARKITDTKDTDSNGNGSTFNQQSSTVKDINKSTLDSAEDSINDVNENISVNYNEVTDKLKAEDETSNTTQNENDNKIENGKLDTNETNNVSTVENSTNNTTETGTVDTVEKETLDSIENDTNNLNENTTVNTSNDVNEVGNLNANKYSMGTADSTITSIENYVEHVFGKRGGMTYSKMLMEFRETLLNIDAMVINELSDLFFNLW